MPTYLFTDKNGTIHEKVMTVAELVKFEQVTMKRKKWTRRIDLEHMNVPSTASCWPMKCDAAGVHPDQCDAAEKESARRGVFTEFDRRTGQAVFRDRAHRARFLKAHGYIDRDGGYHGNS